MDTNRAIAKAFLEAWCTREFDGLDPWFDDATIQTLRAGLRAVPLEVLRADVLTVDDGLQFEFRFRVPSETARGHVVQERVLVRTDGDRVSALDLFGTRVRVRSRELVAS